MPLGTYGNDGGGACHYCFDGFGYNLEDINIPREPIAHTVHLYLWTTLRERVSISLR